MPPVQQQRNIGRSAGIEKCRADHGYGHLNGMRRRGTGFQPRREPHAEETFPYEVFKSPGPQSRTMVMGALGLVGLSRSHVTTALLPQYTPKSEATTQNLLRPQSFGGPSLFLFALPPFSNHRNANVLALRHLPLCSAMVSSTRPCETFRGYYSDAATPETLGCILYPVEIRYPPHRTFWMHMTSNTKNTIFTPPPKQGRAGTNKRYSNQSRNLPS